jgi:hypothetical protein
MLAHVTNNMTPKSVTVLPGSERMYSHSFPAHQSPVKQCFDPNMSDSNCGGKKEGDMKGTLCFTSVKTHHSWETNGAHKKKEDKKGEALRRQKH